MCVGMILRVVYICTMGVVEITRSISVFKSSKQWSTLEQSGKEVQRLLGGTRVVRQNSISLFSIHISVNLFIPSLQTAQQGLRSR
jgi:hypothetical protein